MIFPFKTLAQRIDEAVRAERERCIECVIYAACLGYGDHRDRLRLAFKLINRAEYDGSSSTQPPEGAA